MKNAMEDSSWDSIPSLFDLEARVLLIACTVTSEIPELSPRLTSRCLGSKRQAKTWTGWRGGLA
jgi:hypothetical protein